MLIESVLLPFFWITFVAFIVDREAKKLRRRLCTHIVVVICIVLTVQNSRKKEKERERGVGGGKGRRKRASNSSSTWILHNLLFGSRIHTAAASARPPFLTLKRRRRRRRKLPTSRSSSYNIHVVIQTTASTTTTRRRRRRRSLGLFSAFNTSPACEYNLFHSALVAIAGRDAVTALFVLSTTTAAAYTRCNFP